MSDPATNPEASAPNPDGAEVIDLDSRRPRPIVPPPWVSALSDDYLVFSTRENQTPEERETVDVGFRDACANRASYIIQRVPDDLLGGFAEAVQRLLLTLARTHDARAEIDPTAEPISTARHFVLYSTQLGHALDSLENGAAGLAAHYWLTKLYPDTEVENERKRRAEHLASAMAAYPSANNPAGPAKAPDA